MEELKERRIYTLNDYENERVPTNPICFFALISGGHLQSTTARYDCLFERVPILVVANGQI